MKKFLIIFCDNWFSNFEDIKILSKNQLEQTGITVGHIFYFV